MLASTVSGLPGIAGGCSAFREGRQCGRRVDVHDAESLASLDRNLEAADGHVAPRRLLRQHGLVVHLVDMVTGQHDDELGASPSTMSMF